MYGCWMLKIVSFWEGLVRLRSAYPRLKFGTSAALVIVNKELRRPSRSPSLFMSLEVYQFRRC